MKQLLAVLVLSLCVCSASHAARIIVHGPETNIQELLKSRRVEASRVPLVDDPSVLQVRAAMVRMIDGNADCVADDNPRPCCNGSKHGTCKPTSYAVANDTSIAAGFCGDYALASARATQVCGNVLQQTNTDCTSEGMAGGTPKPCCIGPNYGSCNTPRVIQNPQQKYVEVLCLPSQYVFGMECD